MTGSETTKACKKCGVEKPLSEFSRQAEMKDGHVNTCKSCKADYTRAWIERNADRYKANVERRLADPAKQQEARERARRHYRVNRETKMAYQRAYAKAHPEVGRQAWRKRRARIFGVVSEAWTRTEIYERDERICRGCGRHLTLAEAHVDHIVPISKGGSDTKGNLQILCQPCNREKWARTDWVPPKPSLF